jgi:predicted ATPase
MKGASHRPSTMHFTRLELQNWRNFGHCSLRLVSRAFIVGPNASGKSNLLDAFRFLRDIASVGGGGLQAAVRSRGGVAALRALSARRFPDIQIRAEIGTDADDPMWRYELAFNSQQKKPPRIVRERVWRGATSAPIIDRPDPEDRRDPARLTETALERTTANQEFRELVNFLASIRYLHVVPHLIREPERVFPRSADPFGSDLIEQMANSNETTRRRRLDRMTEALRLAVPQVGETKFEQDNRGRWHILVNYQHWRPRGAWQNEETFSDGTLRLLGVLWALQDRGGPLLLEEPELSLSPAIIRRLPSLFARVQRGGRQVIATTHSSDLLTDEGIGLNEVHLLTPQTEGTRVEVAADIAEVRSLLEGGLTMGEAVLPHVSPKRSERLSLLDL